MPVITTETRDAWAQIATSTEGQRPYVGRLVTITKGKYQGDAGRVTWHGRDQDKNTRYQTDALRMLAQMNGREGFRIRVQPDADEAFFTQAEYALCADPQ